MCTAFLYPSRVFIHNGLNMDLFVQLKLSYISGNAYTLATQKMTSVCYSNGAQRSEREEKGEREKKKKVCISGRERQRVKERPSSDGRAKSQRSKTLLVSEQRRSQPLPKTYGSIFNV